MPLEKTSRSPWLPNWRGRKPSRAAGVGGAQVVRQPGDAQEHAAEHQDHQRHGLRGVAGGGFPEGGNAVGGGLHARERGTSSRIGLHEHPYTNPPRKGRGSDLVVLGCLHVAREVPPEAQPDDAEHADDEAVGGKGEDSPALLDAPQVHESHEANDRHAQSHSVGVHGREGAGDGRDPGGDAHGHRQDVVDQQRGPRHLGWQFPQVLPGDDIGAAAAGIGEDRLAVAHGQDHQQQDDPHGHGPGLADDGWTEGRQRHVRRQGRHDLARGVGHRGERVGAEDRQGDGIADSRLVPLLIGKAPAQQDSSQISHG